MIRKPCDRAHLFCDKCGIEIEGSPRLLPLPFGTFNARCPTEVCVGCFTELVKLVFDWLGRPFPVGAGGEAL